LNTIVLEPGTYFGDDNKFIYPDKNLTIRGNGTEDQVIIDMQGSYKVFTSR